MVDIRYKIKMNYTIFIKDLNLKTKIGIHEFEKKEEQPIIINLKAKMNNKGDIQDISQTICYAKIAEEIELLITERHIGLLETAAEKIKTMLQKKFGITRYHIEINKPNAIKKARAAGIILESGDW